MSNDKLGISDGLASAFEGAAIELCEGSDDVVTGSNDDPIIDPKLRGSVQNMVSPSFDEGGEVIGCWVRTWTYIHVDDLPEHERVRHRIEIEGGEA
jgi:hypothetical protein